MSTDTTPETNGSTPPTTMEPPKPSPLVAIRAEFEKNGGKVDTKKAVACRDAYIKTNEAVAAAEIALKMAQGKNQEAARALMLATGAQPVKFGGTLYNPTSRGDTVFYRPASSKDVLDLSK